MLRSSNIRVLSFTAIVAATLLAACSKTTDAPPPTAAAAAPAPAAEPAPAPKPENAPAFKIGEFSAVALRDGALEFPNDNKVFGVGRTPEEVAALLSAAGLPTDKLQLGLEPLLVKTGDRVMLFDTGAGSNFGPGSGKLAVSFAESGVDQQTVTDIFISHVHGDHVGGLLNPVGELVFPNAKIHLSKPEWAFLSGLTDEQAKSIGLDGHTALVAAIKSKVAAFAPGAELVPGVVKAVEFKGHTPGHSGYRITSGTESLLYIGDTMHHSIISVQKPDWPMNFDADQAAGAKTRVALIAQSEANGQRIYAVHFPFPGLGKFEKRGDGAVWVAE